MSSILPKGIVVNTPEISGDIQKIDREPLALEEIAKFWKVYTTTKRRLADPTAERLENFWWRIWGSRKRKLRGATVARIFADISDEISFVPLRGPLNRDESGGRLTTSLSQGLGTASATAMHGRQEIDSSSDQQSSSLSRSIAAMPPPILKKSRGPSNTGPRPTARFISPHTSEEEYSPEVSPVTGLGAHVIVRPPTPPTPVSQKLRDERKGETLAGSRKKVHGHAATISTHKRRPGPPKRPSSDSAVIAQETISNKDSYKSLPAHAIERPSLGISRSQLGQTSPSPKTLLSVDTLKRDRAGKNGYSKTLAKQSSASKFEVEHGSATSSTRRGLRSRTENGDQLDLTGPQHNHEMGMQGDSAELQSGRSSQPLVAAEPSSTICGENEIQHRPAERYSPENLDSKSSGSVAPAYIAATGETDQRDKSRLENIERQGTLFSDEDRESSSRASEQVTLFARRPVQPVKSTSALFSSPTHQSNSSMSRSKSQLTLLLERDLAREKENKERPDSASKTKDAKQR